MTRHYCWQVFNAVMWFGLMTGNAYIYAGEGFFFWVPLTCSVFWAGWGAFMTVRLMRYRRDRDRLRR